MTLPTRIARITRSTLDRVCNDGMRSTSYECRRANDEGPINIKVSKSRRFRFGKVCAEETTMMPYLFARMLLFFLRIFQIEIDAILSLMSIGTSTFARRHSYGVDRVSVVTEYRTGDPCDEFYLSVR